MRVLLLDVNCKYSSTGKIVYDLYSQFNQTGHTAAIGYGRGKKVEEPNIFKFSSNIEVYFHTFMTRITGLTGCFSFFATKKLIQFIKKFQPDIVHLNDMHGYFVNIKPLMKYLKQNNIPTIWTLHCEFMYTGKCGYSYDCENWKNECGHCPYLKDYPKSLVFDFTKKMFHDKKKIFKDFNNLAIVTPSKWLADRVKQSFLKDKNITVIYNGIDTDNVFHPRSFEHIKKKHNITTEQIVLAVAPDIMNERKGGRYVIELAKKLKKDNVKVILIGVKNLDEKFDDNVIALGRTENQNELAEYYSAANLFVICSKKENLPTTCLEALSCGAPIVGFDTGGTKETAPGELGNFVDYGDIESLYKAVKAHLEMANSMEMINKCVNYAMKHYSRKIMYERYLTLYESKLNDRNL